MDIVPGKIRQKKVKQFLLKSGLTSGSGLAGMEPVCYNEAFSSTYNKHVDTFLIEENIDAVWEIYTNLPPNEAWNGKMVSFGLQYSRRTNTIHYLTDSYTGIEKGQIIIICLKLLGGLLHIAVAHEIAEINEKQKVIKLCYMKGGASEGSQWISLHETEEGFTRVEHLTLYKSKSAFRDRKLYPVLHTRAISEFHDNVRRKALSQKNNEPIPAIAD